jgi:peptidoglycan biosynthesis protein MviN/MurJ (putative lipid II flippase)
MAVVMSFLLVPRFDMLGAALASCAAMMTEATLLWILVRRRLKLNVFAFSPTVFSPSTFMKPRTGDPKP